MAPRVRRGFSAVIWIALLATLSAGCSSSHSPSARAADARKPCTTRGCVEVIYDRGAKNYPYRGVRVDETTVYWSEIVTVASGQSTFKVRAAPKNGGGAIRELGAWSDFQSGASLVVDSTHAYWMTGGSLLKVRKDGSERAELTIPDFDKIDPGPLEDAGDAVVVGSHACRFLTRVPKDGSTPHQWPITQPLGPGGVTGVEVDGPLYYCANGKQVHVLDTRTGQAQEVISYDGQAGAIRKVGQDLYWADSSNPDTKNYALVMLAAGSQQPVAVGPGYHETGNLLYDSGRGTLYWMTGLSNYGCDAVVYDVNSRETSLLASDLNVYGGNAQDPDFIYWAASHAVMRIHK